MHRLALFLRTLGTSMVLVALVACLATPLWAQDLPKRDAYTIQVFAREGTCFYQIEDYPDQDVFVISPGGQVTLSAMGTDAKVVIEKDTEDRLAGAAGDASRKIREGKPFTFTARAPRGRSSRHQVSIRCCDVALGGLLCSGKEDAEPVSAAQELGGLLLNPGIPLRGVGRRLVQPEATGTLTFSFPLFPVGSTLGSGGPAMQVDDDG